MAPMKEIVSGRSVSPEGINIMRTSHNVT